MTLFRFFNKICFIAILFCSPAFAAPLWGNPASTVPRPVIKGVWGEELQNSNNSQVPFDIADFFFDKKEEDHTEVPLPPWLEFAVPIPDVSDDSPMIAIVIDDLGINRKMTKEVLTLPSPLTVSFLYYADHLPEQIQTAHIAGHELLLHTPMEPINSRFDPGPGALRTEMSPEEIKDRLAFMLDSFSGYVGINNHMGSRFTADKKAMLIVMEEVKKRGLLFLDSLTSNRSIAGKIARQKNIPYAVRNVFLDNSQNEQEIMKQLDLLEKHAKKHKFAVGIGHPHKATVNALKKWIPLAKEKGFVFVPVSMIAVYLQDEMQSENVQALNKHDESD